MSECAKAIETEEGVEPSNNKFAIRSLSRLSIPSYYLIEVGEKFEFSYQRFAGVYIPVCHPTISKGVYPPLHIKSAAQEAHQLSGLNLTLYPLPSR